MVLSTTFSIGVLLLLIVIVLSPGFSYFYAELMISYCYADCHCANCHTLLSLWHMPLFWMLQFLIGMLSVILQNAVTSSVIRQNAVMPSVILQNANMPSVILQNAIMPSVILQNAVMPSVILQNAVMPSVIMQNAVCKCGMSFCKMLSCWVLFYKIP